MSETFDTFLHDFDRAAPLDDDSRGRLTEALPEGVELVEGDFADDEKWRLVQTSAEAPPAPETAVAVTDEVESPEIGTCAECGKPIREHEARTEDERGLFHPEHYTAE